MKYWIIGILPLLAAAPAAAESYRVVSSPSLQLEVFIDNVKDTQPESWCRNTLPLRIVSGEDRRDSEVLNNFMPRLGNLLQHQCPSLQSISWQFNNKKGEDIASGSAQKNQNWKVQVAIAPLPEKPAAELPTELSPRADSTAWQRFELPDGCAFRTYWGQSAGDALFIPDDKSLTCGDDKWLSGQTRLSLTVNGKLQPTDVAFIQGYPMAGLSVEQAENIHVMEANNQRLILQEKNLPQSWLVLPYRKAQHAWVYDSTLVVQIDKEQARNANVLKQRLDAVRQAWTPHLSRKAIANILLVENFYPELQDPAIGVYREIHAPR
ncbi:hypothetical protein FJU30_17310 [Affinibrenneria salicis]|uniref:Uncharacterized protein n=1 Tax=Affinibrenneria salicis TaxID=2590031 RepID=A0A5J5FWL6_9GAMM|nr:hypothetical protein [Affinibrenneria salicis]KAA8998172.1 hypothetical protein FJU30_17310 [Affinibrenneria salicis]